MATRMRHSDDAARAQYLRAFEPESFETVFAGEVVELRRG